ncbi:hypothetical protein, partial [Microcoleus sp. herbarium5]|uniref:hypothetical protein n=1 Tax=Microcoleus sp. herbarium5 TaxID=3055434 RepID=UPI002FD31DE3
LRSALWKYLNSCFHDGFKSRKVEYLKRQKHQKSTFLKFFMISPASMRARGADRGMVRDY